MRYNILNIETKGEGWKIAVLQDITTQEVTERVSINKIAKKDNSVFPNFDTLKINDSVEGQLWVSPAGKAYLFAPKPESAPKGNFSGSGASKLMDKKIEAIEKSQDVKSEAIKLTTSMQLAVSLAIAEYANPKSLDTLETLINKYRKFILENWEVDITDTQPF